jgi:Subtilase family
MVRTSVVSCFTAALMFAGAAHAAQPRSFAEQLQQLRASDDGKLHSMLRVLIEPSGMAAAQASGGLAGRLERLGLGHSIDSIPVNIVAKGDAEVLKTHLQAIGIGNVKTFGPMVSARVAATQLRAIASLPDVQSVRPAFMRTRSGLVTTQGDRAQGSANARRDFGVSGRGVRVGILSDSFGCLTGPILPGQPFTNTKQDIANGDLPADIKILNDEACSGSADEGRAIGQIIHDVAPGASLAFHTAFNSEADFAQGIIDLANAGSTIIDDDVVYFDEPMFQDGILAQAVDKVHDRGIPYFSSAGNDARQSYESQFRLSSSKGVSGVRHNFGTAKNPDPMQTITVTDQAFEMLVLNWDEPFKSAGPKGSRSDVDLIFYRMNGQPVPNCNANLKPAVCQFINSDSHIGGDALEEVLISNTSGADVQVQVSIELHAGPAPTYLKYVYFALGGGTIFIDEYDTQSGASYGHANANGAASVGAAPWYNTAAWGVPFWSNCKPACLEYFSSAAGSPIFFNTSGNRLSTPQIRQKPQVTGPDGGNTTFFYSVYTATVPGSTEPDKWPNFFGTSASAPHVAAVAALMIDKQARAGKPAMSPDKIYGILEDTARDMRLAAARTIPPYPFPFGTKGFDHDSGFGFVDADAAVGAAGH